MSPEETLTNLERRELMIDKKREAAHRDHQELHAERIMIPIVRCLEFHVDQVHRGVGAGDVDELQMKEKTRSHQDLSLF